MARDIENAEVASGAVVSIPFVVRAVHGDAIALEPIDPQKQRHPIVTYEARLCRLHKRGDEAGPRVQEEPL